MTRTFFDTRLAILSGIEKSMPRALRYVVDNQHLLVSSDTLMMMIQPIRTILKTPMAEFFDRVVLSGKLKIFAALNLKNAISVPEILTASNITLDLKQLHDQNLIQLPAIHNKVLINITEKIRMDRNSTLPTITAVDNFQNDICRGVLIASHYDASAAGDMWLIPYLSEYVLRSYSMIMSGIIGKYYNLSLVDQSTVGGVFAYFFAQQLSPDPSRPEIFKRCSWLGDATGAGLDMIADVCRSKSSGEYMDLNNVVNAIVELAPERMKNFNLTALISMGGKLGPDSYTSYLALEYVPYWLYCLLLALSGSKIPMTFHLNNQRLIDEGRKRFLTMLMTNERIFDSNDGSRY